MQLPRPRSTQLTFDPSFAGGAWPPVARSGSAVLGEARVGVMGLLSSLEVPLGLTGRSTVRAERLTALMEQLADVDGFWSESADRDRLTTAATLLRQRDTLWAEGWRGQPVSNRLRQLARVTEGVPPGTADRLATVATALSERDASGRGLPIEVRAVEPLNDLPGTLRDLLTGLERLGRLTRVTASEACVDRHRSEPSQPSSARGPAGVGPAARAAGRPLGAHTPPGAGPLAPRPSGGSRPTGLGSQATGRREVQLVRPEGPLAAAEEVAAWLAAVENRFGLEDVLIVNPDSTLDTALHLHGLPTTGVAAPGVGEPVVEVVDLVLRLAWAPCDPDIAQELLLLPDGPLPAGLARQLVKALQSWPAVNSPEWDRRLTDALDALTDPEQELARRRVAALFTPAVPHGDSVPPEALAPRLTLLEAWMTERSETAPAHHAGRWLTGLNRLLALRRLLEAAGRAAVSQADIRRLIRISAEDVVVPSRFVPESGLHWVGDPGAVMGPAGLVVWWDFTRGSEPPVAEPELSDAERSGLADHGITVAAAGTRALARAKRYGRAFRFAGDGAVFVCPRTDARGDEAHPHPLWDELTADLDAATLRDFTAARPTVRTEAERRDRSPQPVPAPRRTWSVPAGIRPPERVSPSSLNSLLGCTVQWALRYPGGVRPGLSADLPNAGRLSGSLAHELVAEVLKENPRDPDAAARRAAELFETLGPRLAAPLFLPGAESARVEARQLVDQCVRALVTIQRTSGLQVVGVEEHLERELVVGLRNVEPSVEPSVEPGVEPAADSSDAPPWSGRVVGRADLLLGTETRHESAQVPPDNDPSVTPVAAVVDLKLGGSRYHYEALHDGTAHQLAVYAWLLASHTDDNDVPAVAYYTLRDDRLMTTTPDVFNSGEVVSGPDPLTTWSHTVEALRRRLDDLAAGRLQAPGNPNDDGDILPDGAALHPEGHLVIPAGCHFCDYGALCGRMFRE